jgi:hypothetical protein
MFSNDSCFQSQICWANKCNGSDTVCQALVTDPTVCDCSASSRRALLLPEGGKLSVDTCFCRTPSPQLHLESEFLPGSPWRHGRCPEQTLHSWIRPKLKPNTRKHRTSPRYKVTFFLMDPTECLPLLTWEREQIQFPKRCALYLFTIPDDGQRPQTQRFWVNSSSIVSTISSVTRNLLCTLNCSKCRVSYSANINTFTK